MTDTFTPASRSKEFHAASTNHLWRAGYFGKHRQQRENWNLGGEQEAHDWDEGAYQRNWVDQHERNGMSVSDNEQPHPQPKITGGLGNRRPLDKDDE